MAGNHVWVGGGGTLGLTLGGTSRRRKLNALRGRLQPINLEVAWDPKVLVNLKWQDDTGM